MTRPLDRACQLEAVGDIDTEGGEFWVENPFMMMRNGNNLSAYEQNCLFLNTGGDGFIDASFASAADIDSDSRAVVTADFDRDGRTDLLVGSSGGGPLRLFANRFPPGHHWVRLELVGEQSNRQAVGARITLRVGDRTIVRDRFPANGCMGLGPVESLIGVGDAESIDEVSVRWTTGQTQTWREVPVGGTVVLRENSPSLEFEPTFAP